MLNRHIELVGASTPIAHWLLARAAPSGSLAHGWPWLEAPIRSEEQQRLRRHHIKAGRRRWEEEHRARPSWHGMHLPDNDDRLPPSIAWLSHVQCLCDTVAAERHEQREVIRSCCGHGPLQRGSRVVGP